MNHVRPSILAALVFTCLAALYVSTASAATGTSTVTWTNPMTYTEGTPMATAEVAGHAYLCTFTPTNGTAAPCSGLAPVSTTGLRASQGFTFTFDGARGGVGCWQVITRATNGQVSDPSALTPASCRTFDPMKPSPPTNVTVTVTVAVATNQSR